MGHWCRICGKVLRNEKFSGGGHRNHVCKKCTQRPKEEQDRIDRLNEISKFLNQTHISDKIIVRLKVLVESPLHGVSDLAKLVLEVGLLYPYKKKRYKKMSEKHKDLLAKLDAADLLPNYYYESDYFWNSDSEDGEDNEEGFIRDDEIEDGDERDYEDIDDIDEIFEKFDKIRP